MTINKNNSPSLSWALGSQPTVSGNKTFQPSHVDSLVDGIKHHAELDKWRVMFLWSSSDKAFQKAYSSQFPVSVLAYPPQCPSGSPAETSMVQSCQPSHQVPCLVEHLV